jgi:hypothetical protein
VPAPASARAPASALDRVLRRAPCRHLIEGMRLMLDRGYTIVATDYVGTLGGMLGA